MLFRKTVFMLALAGAALPAAFANSGTTWAGADGGDHLYSPSHSNSGNSATRADVKKELADSLKNPVADDFSTWVGDGSPYTFEQHSYAFQGGKLVHMDSIAHDTPKPSRVISATEQNLFTERYGS